MFSKLFPRKIFFPEWHKMLEYAEIGCKSRIKKTKDKGLIQYLESKFAIIKRVKESGFMDSGDYYDINPFVTLGFYLDQDNKKYQKIFKKQIYFPAWTNLVVDIEIGCKYLISIAKAQDRELENLEMKLKLIESIKEMKKIDSSSYKDITPFVILGYELVLKKKHHKK